MISPSLLSTLLPMLKSLGTVLKNLFLGFFLIKTGEQKEELEQSKKDTEVLEKELQDVKEAATLKQKLVLSTDDELISILHSNKKPPKD